MERGGEKRWIEREKEDIVVLGVFRIGVINK